MTRPFPPTQESGFHITEPELLHGNRGQISNLSPLVMIAVILVVLALPGCAERGAEKTSEPITVSDVLRGDDAQAFARVSEPREFLFPADHGPHHEYRTEWWYFTGNINDGKGRDFGYQLTFFRFRPRVGATSSPSRWRTEHFYMAHLALTDVGNEKIHAFERFSRGAAGLAGASSNRLYVWLDDWSAGAGSGETFPLRIRAGEGGIALDLILQQGKPVVLHGEDGVSVKNSEPGNASYYYSYTRMPTGGSISVAGESYTVSGNSWMDREWSSSALGKEQLGWDWFALQLSNNHELMYYRFRRADNALDRFSYGAVVLPDGRVHTLGFDEVELDMLDTWQSPGSGVIYPSAWRLRVPEHGLDLKIRPALAAQELDLSFRYWEGAVEFKGSFGASDVDGRGYVELTGYGTTTASRVR